MKTTCFRLSLCCLLFALPLLSRGMSFYLQCPPDVTIQCSESLTDLDKWGKAWVWKDYVKLPAPAPKTVIYNTNACGIGFITRTWEVEDPHWNVHRCSQTITVAAGLAFTSADITWPGYYQIEDCNPLVDPRNLPYGYDYPRFNRVQCSQPMYSYKDTKYTISQGCMKILREWKVIDWCQFVPNAKPVVGLWTYTQVIKLVVNDSSVVLHCPSDTIAHARLDCAGQFVKLDSAFANSQCGYPLAVRNTSPYSRGKGPDASGEYPLGTTEFYYIAEYGCGKEIKCKVKVTVRGKIGPVPYCLNGLVVALMPVDTNRDGTPDDGMIEVWAKDFDIGSYHPCGAQPLHFSFSADTAHRSQIFTCADLGKNEVSMYVTDSSGNQAFCKTYLEIQNNNARIPDCRRKDSIRSTIVVSGLVRDPAGKACADIGVNLKATPQWKVIERRDTVFGYRYDTILVASGNIFYIRWPDTSIQVRKDSVLEELIERSLTDGQGNYVFDAVVAEGDYSLSMDRRETGLDGIDLGDVIVLLKHSLGSERMVDPYQLLAADVNGDRQLDVLDARLLYDIVIGRAFYADLPRHYYFVRDPVLFPDPLHPFSELGDQTLELQGLRHSMRSINYTAVRIGELDGLGGFSSLANRTSSAGQSGVAAFSVGEVYPNPFSGSQLSFPLLLKEKRILQLHLTNAQGQMVCDYEGSFDPGQHRWQISIGDMPAGALLFYSISDGEHIVYGQLIRASE
ncbi:MAG: hypothetical protein KBF37_06225 [Saprospiraceae bacterium]|jgi:hypothetical protein|nr:hypothetical protein [Saprospiraceae bacterium]MBP9209906.1 hypothetical protein [Saprospiraceae bacterium]MBV6473106.1 hypothetical protein [Saprospiraceae bacterium]